MEQTLVVPDKYLQVYPEILRLAACGDTVRTIKRKLARDYPAVQTLPDALVTQWVVASGKELAAAREMQDQYIEQYVGLAQKLERIQRLAEHAEAIKERAEADHRWSGEYRKTISQIEHECEGTIIRFDASDPFAKLLREVAEIGSTIGVGQGHVVTEAEDHRIIRSETDGGPVPIREEQQEAQVALRRGT